MNFRRLFENNKAVSPVIGVVLMVAITVILAAAIGSAVFGQGTSEPAPQADINIKAVNPGADTATVTLEHLGGDPVNFDADSSVTKVMVTIGNAATQVVDIGPVGVNDGLTDAFVLDVGKTQALILNDGIGGNNQITVAAGDTVNFKIVDVATSQLICDQDVRF
ncbi:MAG: type IV pilin [Methanosarcinaceae archaeon]|nr:type IV pilin [Methanosarcinaceae archaeon]